MKFYLAGENPGIDCATVMDDMFFDEAGKKYTYTVCKKKTLKITHPQNYINLSSTAPILLNLQKLTLI